MEKFGSGIWDTHPGSAALSVYIEKYLNRGEALPIRFLLDHIAGIDPAKIQITDPKINIDWCSTVGTVSNKHSNTNNMLPSTSTMTN
jgi:hypothetical protein